MTLLKAFVSIAAIAVSFNASAASTYLDRERLNSCGGTIELREAGNGDLSLKLEDVRSCSQLDIYDVSSGRVIKSYQIQGSSYTLSKKMESELAHDCRLGVKLSGGYSVDRKEVVLSRWSCRPAPVVVAPQGRISYQLSRNGNCKLMINGQYANKNVADSFCQGLSGDAMASYEVSNKGNCKLMINGQYSQRNVADAFCSARH